MTNVTSNGSNDALMSDVQTRVTGSECVLTGRRLTEVLKTKLRSMRSQRKALLPVGGCCPSAGGRGGRHMCGLTLTQTHKHTHTYTMRHFHTVHFHPHKLDPSRSHLQQLLVLVSTGQGLRASEGKREKSDYFQSAYDIYKCFPQRCKVHTIWSLCVADG